MFCNLGEKDCTRFRKKKKKKKGKNLIAAKLVEIKGYFETYNNVKYFLPYLNETTFHAKLLERFLDPKA